MLPHQYINIKSGLGCDTTIHFSICGDKGDSYVCVITPGEVMETLARAFIPAPPPLDIHLLSFPAQKLILVIYQIEVK